MTRSGSVLRKALIVGDAAGTLESATAILRRFGFADPSTAADGGAALEMLRQGHYDLLVIPLQRITPSQLAELDREVRRGRFTFVIGTAPAAESELILRAMRAGVHEFVVSPPAAAELSAAVDRVMRRAPQPAQNGQVVAVYSGKGGLGTTTIAVNLAHAFARNHPTTRVAVADLDVTDSDLRVFLNLPAAYDMGDLLAKLDRVDAELLDSLLAPTPSGIWALPGPDNPELDDEIDSGVMSTIIEHLRAHFAFTVLDCEHHLSDRTLAAMDAADRIILVTQLNVAALKSTQKTLAVCRRLGYGDDRIAVVVNRYQSDDLLRRRDAAKVLTCDVFYSLPNDYVVASDALTKGTPIADVDANSDLARDFSRLAAKLGGTAEPEHAESDAPSESRLGRLFSRRRRA